MGGINPEKGTKSVHTLVQKFSRLLFRAASRFFEAHALLESAVIDESKRETPNITAIVGAQQIMSEVTESLAAAAQQLEKECKVIYSPGWQTSYFELQYERITHMARHAHAVVDLLGSEDMIAAAKRATLQESLWHTEANHKIRLQSIEFLNELMRSLQTHIDFVEVTNMESGLNASRGAK